ncbi:3-ketoacyl-CoA synthase 1-like [Phragmites australis]|uniref:3-ketoacyl-CoA synthase 1-like n=1 Tax=Phragmites australis TaxID=29695 RepID=UPI002D79F5A9|nr:3-ketoacyl-CoA synthase 1-like [Phragmites australis]
MFLPTLDALFTRMSASASAVGALIANCSGFYTAPSLIAIITAHYRMWGDVRTFNLSGMGYITGVVVVNIARGVQRAHATWYAIVVTEIVTVGWYSGRDRCKLLLNYFFRTYSVK